MNRGYRISRYWQAVVHATKTLFEFLSGVCLMADAYVYPRRYTPVSGRGPQLDATNLISDCRHVGDDVSSALASCDVESPYTDSASV